MSKIQVLVIDDDPTIQLVIKKTLAHQGYDVIVAGDGKEGLAKAIEYCPALVICDWLMPKMNGLDVCRHLKAIPELFTTFFILLTSLDSVEDRVKGLDAGADDFLCKPIEMYELKARVRAGLRLHQLSRDLRTQKEHLEAELAQAAEYVSSILPEPLVHKKLNINVTFIPSLQLGGDSFDYFWLDEKHLVMYLLDVSGHGLRSALPSLAVVNLLRSNGLHDVSLYKPAQVLEGLNQIFPMTVRNDKYFTIWYGVYHVSTRELVYASGGHPPAILFLENSMAQSLKTQGFPVGIFPDSIYESGVVTIKPNSTLYIFSDGIYEFTAKDKDIWGIDSFVDFLKKEHRYIKEDLNVLIEDIKKLNDNRTFTDDVSVMQVRFS